MGTPLHVVGAGLAGSEAALQLAGWGHEVVLWEMRPEVPTAAHQTANAAELVCSNSLGSRLPDRAGGVLQAELRALGCRLLPLAEATAVPAGAALAVDRDRFGEAVTAALEAEPRIELRRAELQELPPFSPEHPAVVASGPLTSPALAEAIQAACGREHLAFFDALAPVVTADSLDRSVIFAAARWGNGDPDYLNIPLDKEQYLAFHAALLDAEAHPLKDFEAADPRAKLFFERCLPIEQLAARGLDALRYGPMRPVGLDDPRTGRRPWAVIQLRRENVAGTLYNLVGCQTNVRHGAQETLLRSLPGMAEAEFVRLGSMHRNTFLDSPELLDAGLMLEKTPGLFFAGQITGMEGYLGNIGSGLIAALGAARLARGEEAAIPPDTTLLGALCRHVASSPARPFQPMKAEFGLLPPLVPARRKAERRQAYAARSAAAMETFRHNLPSTESSPTLT
jgi:methylenetetrahydrofolate--tRNA-(uracil-5-)-methyltransferase